MRKEKMSAEVSDVSNEVKQETAAENATQPEKTDVKVWDAPNEYAPEPDDLLHTKPSEKVTYFWAATDPRHPNYYKRLMRRGWHVVKKADKPNVAYSEDNEVYRIDELVLMEIPTEEKKRQDEAYERRVLSMLGNDEFEGMVSIPNNEDVSITTTENEFRFVEGVFNKNANTAEREKRGERSVFYIPNNPLAK